MQIGSQYWIIAEKRLGNQRTVQYIAYVIMKSLSA